MRSLAEQEERKKVRGLMKRIGESVRGRLAGAKLDSVEDGVRRFILGRFAACGKAPSPEEIAKGVGLASLDVVRRALGMLESADLLSTKGGKIVSAYPFSAQETRHRVIFGDGRQVFALCATDALGIHFMLDEAITVLSRCPSCDREMRVTVEDGRIESRDTPGMVEFVAERERGGCTAATCCPYINFFCSGEHLERWQTENPALANGETCSLEEALRHGRDIFGDFLSR